MAGKLVGFGNAAGMAVASETVEKSGHGLVDAGTGRFCCFKRSGRHEWLWSSYPDNRSTGSRSGCECGDFMFMLGGQKNEGQR